MNTPNSETPRTDAFVEADWICQLPTYVSRKLRIVELLDRISQLEKELHEAKAAIQLMEHGKYGRVDLSEQIRQLTSRLEASEYQYKIIQMRIVAQKQEMDAKLEASERVNSEMRSAIQTFLSAEFMRGTSPYAKAIVALEQSIFSTSDQSYVPREVPTGTEAEVCSDIIGRQKKGVAKYGVTVAENPLELNEWLNHAYQECLDMAVYLKRAQSYGLGKEKE